MKGTTNFKRIIATIAVLTAATATTTAATTVATAAAVPSSSIIGDINGDGRVNAVDASMILKHYADVACGGETTSTINAELADVNGDTKVNAIDASIVLVKYANISSGTDTAVWPPYSISKSLLKSGHSYTFMGGVEIPLYIDMGQEFSDVLKATSIVKVEKYCLGKWYKLTVEGSSYWAHIPDEEVECFQSLMPENTILSEGDLLTFKANSYCLYDDEGLENVVAYMQPRSFVRIVEVSETIPNSYKVQINDRMSYYTYIDQDNLNLYFADAYKDAFNQ